MVSVIITEFGDCDGKTTINEVSVKVQGICPNKGPYRAGVCCPLIRTIISKLRTGDGIVQVIYGCITMCLQTLV